MTSLFAKSVIFSALLFISDNPEIISTSLNGGKCTGSPNCTACSNCSRCQHCNAGGTCGVCSGRSSTPSYQQNNQSTPAYSNPNNTRNNSGYSSQPEKVTELKLIVISQELKLRKGPGSQFDIIEDLTLGDQLLYITKDEGWIKVKTPTNHIGYVFYKFVKFMD